MDEEPGEVREAARECAFALALLNAHDCSHAERYCIGERSGVRCGAESPWRRCRALRLLLRERARFALATPGTRERLSHAQSLRLQLGGLRGIATALAPDASTRAIRDVHALLVEARARYGSLEALPFEHIVRRISAYRGRRREQR
ncbi:MULTISPECIES: hypothetical protein [Marichromatium]|uniref:Uncharacterized protein n=1 Tax=Marichromatium gracile TaxID=1048 RepID=A0A4R4A9X2_MARGR|nr:MULTISPECIES: hypothetical protein [Marichromatium]MBK1708485.1 hypothetical protein [Marichromatium gracile]RNE89962.1 hypothetical protein EBL84_09785 [Marichromatium sp. AB31]TCW35625.1 hypothetical protein EDC29_106193 [Marichromatium gracile]